MHTSLALALALALTNAAPIAPAEARHDAWEAPDVCAGAGSLPGQQTCGDRPLCSPRDRAAITCELRQAVTSRYVFHGVKPALLAAAGQPGFDSRRHLDACVEQERAIADEQDPLRFYDRMRRCIAGFEDGHLLLSVPGKLSTVSAGVALRRAADGRIHVASRAPALLRWLETEGGIPDAATLLATGVEVVAVDGAPVSDALAELAAHLPSSSPAARLERAVDALTRRDFDYPRAPALRLTLAVGGARRDVELPWWIAPGAGKNPLFAAYLARVPLRTTELLDWSAAPRWAVSDPAAGVSRGDPVLAPAEARRLQEYRGDGGHLAARLGEGTGADGRAYCYAQLLTMHTETLRADGEARKFVPVVEEFIRGCEARGLDLVLDLRQNEGGYISHSTAIARLLAPEGAPVARGALLLRANDYNERVFRERAPALGGIRAVLNGARTEAEEILEAIRAARAGGEPFTPAFLDAPAEGAPGAFAGRVVVLVSPTCMSACERLAAMLGSAGAVRVGGPTEGAGGSQQQAKGVSARWVDASGRLAVSLPSAAMGVEREATSARTASSAEFYSDLALENRPILPDVPYATTVEDLTGANAGWRAAAEAALHDGREGSGVAGTRGGPEANGVPRV